MFLMVSRLINRKEVSLFLLYPRVALKKIILTLDEMEKQALLRTISIGIGTTAMEFCSMNERFGSTPYTPRKGGDLQPRSKVEVCRWEIIKRKHQRLREAEFLLNLLDRILALCHVMVIRYHLGE